MSGPGKSTMYRCLTQQLRTCAGGARWSRTDHGSTAVAHGRLNRWAAWLRAFSPSKKVHWLVISNPLNNISQLGWFFPIYVYIYGKIIQSCFSHHQPVHVIQDCSQSHQVDESPKNTMNFTQEIQAENEFPGPEVNCSIFFHGFWDGLGIWIFLYV